MWSVEKSYKTIRIAVLNRRINAKVGDRQKQQENIVKAQEKKEKTIKNVS